MADQKTITLRQGHGTASTIILRALPIPDAVTTTIVLYGLHATPSTVVFRNPLTIPDGGGGGPTIIETEAASSGVSTVTGLAAAIWLGLGESVGLASITGVSAAVVTGVGAADGLGTGTGVSGALWAIVANGAGLSEASGTSGATCGAAGQASGSADCVGVGERGLSGTYIEDRVTYTGPPPRITAPSWSPHLKAVRRHTWRDN